MEFSQYVKDATLSIIFKDLSHKDVQDLVGFLQKNPYITQLILNDNKIGAKEAKALAAELAALKNLTSLDLQRNYIGDEGAKALAAELAKLKNLTFLDLSWNNIGAEGAKELIEPMEELAKLDKLSCLKLGSCFPQLFEFFDHLKELPPKTDEELYRSSVKKMAFAIARKYHDDQSGVIEHIYNPS